ncbi:MAG: 8-amino-7-oxononanoate synthase [Thermodesulfobacteriota bacterium]
MDKWAFVEKEFARRKAADQVRTLTPVAPKGAAEVLVNGRPMLNFCSNDYLGLSKHPAIIEASVRCAQDFGAGSTASRLVCGDFTVFGELEREMAAFKGTEDALVLTSGFQANASLLPALADRGALILSDQLNHNSLIQGARLCRCDVKVFRHNDLDHLRELLISARKVSYSRILITTESVFSMDGDRADIEALAALSEEFAAILFVDEAHATGVFGRRGAGMCHGKNVDVVMGTFGKALGCFGAYVACSSRLKSYLINCCAGLIYTTALPPAVIGSIRAALPIAAAMDEERRAMLLRADRVRAAVHDLGWETGASDTHIVPVLVGPESETLALSAYLKERGILATAIRPPTVEPGRSRIRLAVCAQHTNDHIERLVSAFAGFKEQAA